MEENRRAVYNTPAEGTGRMPGFEELKKFRDIIASLGDERKIAEEQDGVYEELPLPPESPSAPAHTPGPAHAAEPPAGRQAGAAEHEPETASDFSDIPLDADPDSLSALTPENGEGAPDLSELDAMLNSLPLGSPDDLDGFDAPDSALHGAQEPVQAVPADDAGETAVPEDFDRLFPPDFDHGTPEEVEAEKAAAEDADVLAVSDTGAGSAAPDGAELPDMGSLDGLDGLDLDNLDLGGLDNLDLSGLDIPGADNADADAAADNAGGADNADAGADNAGGAEPENAEFSPEDFGFSMDEPGAPQDFSRFATPAGADSLAVPEDAAGGTPEDADASAAAGGAELPDMGSLDGLDGLGSLDLGGLDGLDSLDLGGADNADASAAAGAENAETGAGTDAASGQEFGGLQDLDGFDFDESVLNAAIRNASPSEKVEGFSEFESGGKKNEKKGKVTPTEISEAEFERFLSLLSRFPLNLRLAVEEFLSDEEGPETPKMELVCAVLDGTPLRKVANVLEKQLDRSIAIPKDFEKKNFEEYELEKSSLKYVFFNRVLPVASVSGILALLTACIVFLSYQFIYRPVSAEGLYKRGLQAIEGGLYPQSEELFNRAVERWEKKRWYFTFARSYREKNQYIAAESMYTRLLDRYNNDLEGGLEYAEMLRTDLRNFEKAETVLRRRVLDFHVNQQDALLLLGDVFLDWAEEDPEKYEQARLQFATVLQLYGSTDPALSGMLRYFIRTDNLAEVLPLKDHFMGRGAKIRPQDLVELGGYLVTKRYEPAPGDSDTLRDAIGDLRTLLERGLEAGPEIPESHYNMGRFFIYNYEPGAASGFLNDALRLFGGLRQVSPRRIVTHVDAYRLLGGLRADDMEYLRAQELYAAGISLYEERRAARSVPQDPRVGRLYAQYADVDYFVTGDWDAALHNYRKAVAEQWDTPSVRYRTGWLYYERGDYAEALPQFVRAYSENNRDPVLLYALGNTLFRRGSWNAARGYYERLMEMSEAERVRKGILLPQVRADHGAFVEGYMHAANNLGVTLYNLADRTGETALRSRAYALFSESARAWDALTRNPDTMVRAQGSNLAFLNMRAVTAPAGDFAPEIYTGLPKTLRGERVLRTRAD